MDLSHCMAIKNRYSKGSHISERKFREIVRYFAADLTALQTTELSRLNRNTINRIYRTLRERIYWACEADRPFFGVVEVDESYFGARRVKGRRGRGAYGKTAVFGIYKRAGRVYTEIVPDRSMPTLQGIIYGVGLTRLPSSTSGRTFQGRVRQWPNPYQRHRRLLGIGKSQAHQVQGRSQTHLSSTPEGNKMAL